MKQTLKLIIIYTVLFGIITAGVFVLFILAHKSFIQYGDGYKQGYFWVVEVRDQLRNLMSGNGIQVWSWSKGFGMDTSVAYLLDPFMIIAALFPPGYIELGYTVSNVLKLYCGGLAFLAFSRYIRLGDYQIVMGSLCYAFSVWFIEVALCQSSLLMNTYLFPLLVLGVEIAYRKKNPVLFIIMVGYYMLRTFYFAYMSAIVIILYVLLRYFAYHDQFSLKDYMKNIGAFVIYGICGCLISFVTMLPYVREILGASTESASDDASLLFDFKYYLGFGDRLIGRGLVDDYLDIGVPIIILLLLPVAVKKISRKETGTVMTIILFIMMMIPFFCSMFNAFGYPTLRWTYMFLFFAVWAAMSVMDMQELKKKSNLILMAVWLVVLTAWTIGPVFLGILYMDRSATLFVIWNLFAGVVILLTIWLGRQKIVAFFALGAIVIGWNLSILHNTDMFLRNNQVNEQLSQSTQRAGSQIEDEGFFRIDQVDGLNQHKVLKSPANESMWWKTKHIYVYDSKLPVGLFEFNKSVGNNYGYYKRVSILSNDNRMGLDYLTDVRYFLGDDTVNGRVGSDAYAGYGFTYLDTIDGVRVFKSKYETSIGYAYDHCISESEFAKLSRLEREQALMQAAVIPDDKKTNVSEIRRTDIETDIKDVTFSVINVEGASLDGNRITTNTADASFDLQIQGVKDSQVVLSFDNLHRTGSTEIDFTIENEKVSKMLLNNDSNQTIPNRCDYDVNMGYYDGDSGVIRITIKEPGEYIFDKMYISAMAAGIYDKYATIREESLFDVTDYDDEKVTGTVDVRNDSILYFSIPTYADWDIYVDGVEQTRIDGVNIGFMGTEISKGKHEVELRYDFSLLKYSAGVSLLGILLAIAVCIINRRRR